MGVTEMARNQWDPEAPFAVSVDGNPVFSCSVPRLRLPCGAALVCRACGSNHPALRRTQTGVLRRAHPGLWVSVRLRGQAARGAQQGRPGGLAAAHESVRRPHVVTGESVSDPGDPAGIHRVVLVRAQADVRPLPADRAGGGGSSDRHTEPAAECCGAEAERPGEEGTLSTGKRLGPSQLAKKVLATIWPTSHMRPTYHVEWWHMDVLATSQP